MAASGVPSLSCIFRAAVVRGSGLECVGTREPWGIDWGSRTPQRSVKVRSVPAPRGILLMKAGGNSLRPWEATRPHRSLTFVD